jgi:hypothetical protein
MAPSGVGGNQSTAAVLEVKISRLMLLRADKIVD